MPARQHPTPPPPGADPTGAYLTLDDAAERLCVTRRTLDNYIADGALQAYRFGPRLVRVRWVDVEALLVPIEATK
ncbi:helix-turn-helix transcriptional regulator [Cellulosimicrobium sp. JZ28]|uniref:helix-turn-helix transcriptional regulator n=1 Tax=Cellulosimicrobium sp. JZ28 TaxID=1906273 RepID=UPI00188A7D19|nr:helix-turn-helix domain-containing protein [Cellulosimicrobium sp. JZ28]